MKHVTIEDVPGTRMNFDPVSTLTRSELQCFTALTPNSHSDGNCGARVCRETWTWVTLVLVNLNSHRSRSMPFLGFRTSLERTE